MFQNLWIIYILEREIILKYVWLLILVNLFLFFTWDIHSLNKMTKANDSKFTRLIFMQQWWLMMLANGSSINKFPVSTKNTKFFFVVSEREFTFSNGGRDAFAFLSENLYLSKGSCTCIFFFFFFPKEIWLYILALSWFEQFIISNRIFVFLSK